MTARVGNKANTARAPVKAKAVKAHETAKELSAGFPIVGIGALAKVLQLSRAKILKPYRTQRVTKDGTVLEVWMTSTALVNEAGQTYAIATTERAKESNDGGAH